MIHRPNQSHGFTPSPRQRQVLQGVSDGLTAAQIATRLGISRRTVETHLKELRRRTKARSVAQLSAHSVAAGWVKPSSWPTSDPETPTSPSQDGTVRDWHSILNSMRNDHSRQKYKTKQPSTHTIIRPTVRSTESTLLKPEQVLVAQLMLARELQRVTEVLNVDLSILNVNLRKIIDGLGPGIAARPVDMDRA